MGRPNEKENPEAPPTLIFFISPSLEGRGLGGGGLLKRGGFLIIFFMKKNNANNDDQSCEIIIFPLPFLLGRGRGLGGNGRVDIPPPPLPFREG